MTRITPYCRARHRFALCASCGDCTGGIKLRRFDGVSVEDNSVHCQLTDWPRIIA